MAASGGGEHQQAQAQAIGGLFGDDDEDPDQQFHEAGGLGLDEDDILGLDDAAVEAPPDHEGGLLMRFCPHDSSMLYPKENPSERKLVYACRLCRYTEYAAGQLIYKNVLKKEVGNILHTVPADVSDDPTLPRSQNAHCGKCGHSEAVYFQSDTSDVRSESLALIFVCCNCGYKWVA
ncbi:hypothetical protein THAOC_01103 [Thalassiosira oceanica]|uniref:TFIIS-type domain-containing protein n=1 Tax=Thalassiosira oceanica TaxID=159749 RepID=K0THW0_THAOC|nr:hypothetical protein THAOC_01103 [Thalassiosira oceanica]|mmetsp:Transcript_8891/g.20669  ORF Transcript_8891/g.20669 Transcript_8891/m.20669 type:complete len:177 (-) Transcript_8891:750-1280(-)|eukprot:EJK77090.1 hypothetical protein THAOC_01103 [Thalassiosira oceanica]